MRGKMREMAEFTKETGESIRQLLIVAALLIIGYTCIHTLRFTVGPLNFIFVCAFLIIPFFAIRPVLRLHRQPRVLGWGSILLTPLLVLLLVLSSFLLLGTVLDGLFGGAEDQTLQTFQLGSSTVRLDRYSNGGAVGVHGLYLEQRRPIIPGLYIVKPVAFFDSERDGTLCVEGPYRVRVAVKGSYSDNNCEVDKVYSLKPWVYF